MTLKEIRQYFKDKEALPLTEYVGTEVCEQGERLCDLLELVLEKVPCHDPECLAITSKCVVCKFAWYEKEFDK